MSLEEMVDVSGFSVVAREQALVGNRKISSEKIVPKHFPTGSLTIAKGHWDAEPEGMPVFPRKPYQFIFEKSLR